MDVWGAYVRAGGWGTCLPVWTRYLPKGAYYNATQNKKIHGGNTHYCVAATPRLMEKAIHEHVKRSSTVAASQAAPFTARCFLGFVGGRYV